jgi:hypothetical protein
LGGADTLQIVYFVETKKPMFENTIKTLQELARSNQGLSEEIGFAIGLLEFCKKNNISTKDNVLELPTAADAFGYYVIQECTENGNYICTVNDKNGKPLEVMPEALVIERKLK